MKKLTTVGERALKAITVSQPFASLIADGSKFVENRIWETKYRGLIAIHAGQGKQYLSKSELEKYPTGCVIAIAELTACVMLEQIEDMDATATGRWSLIPGSGRKWGDVANHYHTEGPWCWILENVEPIKPIPAKGLQRIWNWNAPSGI